MNYGASRFHPSGTARRSGLLGVVIALHLGLLFLIMTARNIVPTLLETPLMVQFIDPPRPVELAPAPAPQQTRAAPTPPASRPRPLPTPPPKSPAQQSTTDTPALETTSSNEPAPANAPIALPEPRHASPAVAQKNTGVSEGNGESVVSGVRFDADYLKNPPPPYPPQSRRLAEEGKVILRVLVSAEGNALQVEIKDSSESSRLDDSAQRTVRHWKFIPAKRGGIAIESWVLIPIVFKLEQ